jgi:peptidoglycan hydrolase-like protein with peptidoglycan-binding domain
MKTRILVVMGSLALTLMAPHVSAQTATDVQRAQQALKQAGHDPGPVDGVMGAQTSAALKAYQKEQGLSVTGQFDAETAAKLGEGSNAPAASAQTGGDKKQTGGDKKPNAVDPAQGTKTGGNVGEGASYSRSTEKGASTK